MRHSLLATLIAGALLSLDAQALDLLQVYQEALANDAPFASARASLTAGQEKVAQGRAGLLPQLGVSGSYSRNDVESLRSFSGNGYTVSLSQPLFRVANWEQYQQGKLSTASSEAQFAQAQQDLIVRVAQAYFDVLGAQDALASVQAQKSAITEQLASAKRNFEVGTATITDTHEAQARFDLAVAQEFAAQNDLDIKRAALQQIIGKPAGDLAQLRPGIKLNAPQPGVIDTWVQSAEQQNFGVVGQQLALEIARRDIKRNRAGHYPTVDLVASRNHSNNLSATASALPTAGGVTNTNSVGVQWSIPLFSGFAVDSRVRESIALEERARADLENARRTAAQGARQSFLGVNAGLAQVKALEAAEVSSQSALDSNRLGYQVGVRINIDVLNAQQQLFSTRRDLAKARYDTIVNGLKLKSAAGTLKEDDVVQVNALLSQGAPAGAALGADPTMQPGTTGTSQPAAGTQQGPKQPPLQLQSPPGSQSKSQPQSSVAAEEVLATVDRWAEAWSARDTTRYLGFYSDNFKTPHGQSHAAWAARRQAMIAQKKKIEVKIEAPGVTVTGDTATVRFRQLYRSDRNSARNDKVLFLVKEGGSWRIAQETAS